MATKDIDKLYIKPYERPRYTGLFFTEVSKTRPNGALSLQQLFTLHRRGQIVQPTMQSIDNPKFVNYLCELDDHDLTQLDKIRQRSSELYAQRSKLLEEQQKSVKVDDVVPTE